MKNALPMVSIVVPVYNGEKCLARCVESIVSQTYKDWELLLIDDGSKDQSLSLCKEYESKCSNIRVIHKENEGVSATRNRGLQEAKGTYIQFVDCDDYVEKDFLEQMVLSMEQNEADFVVAGYTRRKDGTITRNCPNPQVLTGKKEIAASFFVLYNQWYLNTPWNKLFRREKIVAGFRKEISLGEDLLFNLEYLKQVDKLVVIAHAGYQYCIENQQSLAIQFREDRFENTLFLHNALIEFVKEELGMVESAEWNDIAFIKGIRFSITNLMRADTVSAKKKKEYIKNWISNEEVKAAYGRCTSLEKKDEILKILVQRNAFHIIYWMMRLAG